MVRTALHWLADVTGIWDRLPGRVQGWLCDCPICRGEEPCPTCADEARA